MPNTHGPIDPNYAEMMRSIAAMLDEVFNEGQKVRSVGFALLVFPFGDATNIGDRINYMSNAQREDMLVAMKEFIAKAEGMQMPESKEKQ